MLFDWSFEGVATDSPVIEDALLCGLRSKNGYGIPPAAFGGRTDLYEKVSVFIDHDYMDPTGRSVRQLAGHVENVRYDDKGRPRGDIRCYETDAGKLLLSLARSQAKGVGMSHVAKYTFDESSDQVDLMVASVDEVFSVDIVVNPATTNGFHEHTKQSEGMEKSLEQELRNGRDQAVARCTSLEADLKTAQESAKSFEADLAKSAAELKAANDRITALEAEVDGYKAAESVQKRTAAVLQELKAAGINTESAEECSESFKAMLLKVEKPEDRKPLIEDRVALLEAARNGGGVQQSPRKPAGSESNFDVEAALKGVISE